MLNLILKLIRTLLASLYMLFEGLPAFEALRSWFGAGEAAGEARARLLTLAAVAAALSILAFILFLWLLSRKPVLIRGKQIAVAPSGEHPKAEPSQLGDGNRD